MKKSTPRRIAVEILNRVEEGGAFAEPLLNATLSGTELENPADRGLLTELVYGTLRMRGRLDWVIAELYRGSAAELETTVRNILRTGLYQMRFTDRIPPFAAVNEAVEIARDLAPAAAGLVNAILRNSLRKGDAVAWPDIINNPAKAIAVLHSHPLWLVRRLLASHGVEETIAICGVNNTVPPLTLRVNSLKASRDRAIAALLEEKIAAEGARFSPDGITVISPAAALRKTACYRKGLIRVQDEASQLVTRLVAPEPGEKLLDLCAGSGGKTLHLAALMGNSGSITALDVQPARLRMLRGEAKRLGVTIAETRPGDAVEPVYSFRETFDRVLLDAPCSGLGTIRRNPEIRWRITPADINRCRELQDLLLTKAAEYVRPGGRLVYSVCTVTPEENEVVIGRFLKERADFHLISPDTFPPALIDGRGFFRSEPHIHGMDGFFGAVLVRAA
jgi:16S rRNA (cytosine967-C5)-methyltransferase